MELTAYGPLGQIQAANRISVTQWVVPGKHIREGDAWMVEIPGFVVDILAPPTHIKHKGTLDVTIKAHVTMMCGCPIAPGGLWDSEKYEIMAEVKQNGKHVAELPMKYTGETSKFVAKFKATEKGVYEMMVYAYDKANGNTGIDKVNFIIE